MSDLPENVPPVGRPNAVDSGPSLAGQVLDGRYRVVAEVGRGAMGVVYRAVVKSGFVERDVAIKVLIPEPGPAGKSLAARFEHEAKIIAQLRHPNTIRLEDVGRLPDGRMYVVTEFSVGQPLAALIAAGPMAPRRVLALGRQVADALAEAHGHGIVHRDLKPGNVFVERVGSSEFVKILDYGIAKADELPDLTQPDQIFGTPGYMAPEQIRGERATAQSDIYALGVVLFECLAGLPLYSAPGGPVALFLLHLNAPVPSLAERVSAPIPPEVESIVRQMLDKDPAARPASMAELRDRMDALLASPALAEPAAEPPSRPRALSLGTRSIVERRRPADPPTSPAPATYEAEARAPKGTADAARRGSSARGVGLASDAVRSALARPASTLARDLLDEGPRRITRRLSKDELPEALAEPDPLLDAEEAGPKTTIAAMSLGDDDVESTRSGDLPAAPIPTRTTDESPIVPPESRGSEEVAARFDEVFGPSETIAEVSEARAELGSKDTPPDPPVAESSGERSALRFDEEPPTYPAMESRSAPAPRASLEVTGDSGGFTPESSLEAVTPAETTAYTDVPEEPTDESFRRSGPARADKAAPSDEHRVLVAHPRPAAWNPPRPETTNDELPARGRVKITTTAPAAANRIAVIVSVLALISVVLVGLAIVLRRPAAAPAPAPPGHSARPATP